MTDWVSVCTLADIPPQGSRVIKRAHGEDIAVFRTLNDEVFALFDRCPHKGGPLSQGLVHGKSVTCPLHGWVIALDGGQVQAPDQGCANKVLSRLEAGVVYLAL
ncbi:nitrite reductase small subunit NirD [Craterilacuibacter sp. RT1T]|uniref:nitrite reductase small subunit NirD n=1 Tax=Craterilacuibacter sp. RT1T TaxID=2942211 RepID=UPI0020BFA247|nr:nitrite reductase small subunit NirD [Craterilacuibacter sp. RT1T]MCL6263295.1 nitrite reductase small subunit NirD [Craterilacuibacter sp. RT1T]